MMTYPMIKKGFTLVELLFVIAILSISLSIVIPFTTAFVQGQAKESSRQNVLSALRFARASAIDSRELTTVCSLNPTGECRPEWDKTLDVFEDPNGNGLYDSGEQLLRSIQIDLGQWSQRNRPGSRAHFQWNSLGISNGTPGSIEFCHPGSGRNRFAIVVSFSGRIRTSFDYNGDGTEERVRGTPIAC
jgi:type IV fimbrial biogenesis protein FimT